MEDRKNNSSGRNFVISALVSIPVILIVKSFWPDLIPFGVFDFWRIKSGPLAWLKDGWPLLVWGVGLNIVMGIFRRDERTVDSAIQRMVFGRPSGWKMFKLGVAISLWAGIAEEIAFRWLIFLAAMATIRIPNFLLFGFLGFGIPEWFHLNIWGPLANWTTFGQLTDHIFPTQGWAIGGALLSTNAFFRDGHRYQGLLGAVNSWFIGMFFFWAMFRHGLIAAIALHICYDLLIFSYGAIRLSLKR
jgi:hypothetical protein